MGAAEIIALITGILEFPKQILALINVLRSTPQEQHDAIMGRIAKEKEDFENGGRPQ